MSDPGPDVFALALACYRTPLAHQDRLAASAPLPEDMSRLLRLASGAPDICEDAARRTGARPDELRDAARFLIQQLCFVRGADHYRLLGLEPDAPFERIKEHHRLLMRLFHPDRAAGREAWTDRYAARTNEAWTVLSRARSRADYDAWLRRRPEQALVPGPATGAPAVPRTRPTRAKRSRRPSAGRSPPRFALPRRWVPVLVLGGAALAAALTVAGVYLARTPSEPAAFVAAADVESERPATFLEPQADPADRSAIGAFLAMPDWQSLERRERQARQQAVRARATRQEMERTYQERLAAEEAPLERMRAERARVEEELKAEQARAEQSWAARLAAEQQRLKQLQAEQARIEQERSERLAAERRRLEELRAEQARAEQLADELRAERRRLEQARVGQARAEPKRLEEQAKQTRAERGRAEPVRSEIAAAGAVPAMGAMPDEREPTDRELDDLIGRYTAVYLRGDVEGLMTLFAPGARGRNGGDRGGIRQDYAALFGSHLVRRLELHDLRWDRRAGSATAAARYELWLRRRADGELIQLTGNIRFEAGKQDGRVFIQAIDYDWPANRAE
ncbi:MAG: DnaJ domain-containing protein [Candidatus Competibacter sp.]|nr:DnaJ domain-containing protein [Candidatus Competibacter sp.]